MPSPLAPLALMRDMLTLPFRLEATLRETNRRLEATAARLDEVSGRLDALNRRADVVVADIDGLRRQAEDASGELVQARRVARELLEAARPVAEAAGPLAAAAGPLLDVAQTVQVDLRQALPRVGRVNAQLDDVIELAEPIQALADRLERAVGVFQRD